MNNPFSVCNFYYNTIKWMIQSPEFRVRGPVKFIRYDILYWVLFLCLISSMLQILYMGEVDSITNSQRINWNPLVTVLNQMFHDWLMCTANTWVWTYCLYLTYFFYHKPYQKLTIGRILHQLVVVNYDWYRSTKTNNLKQRLTRIKLVLHSNKMKKKKSLQNGKQENQASKQFESSNFLSDLPGLPISIRLRMICYLCWLERIISVLIILNALGLLATSNLIHQLTMGPYLQAGYPSFLIWPMILTMWFMITHTSYFCMKMPCLQLFLSWYVTKLYRLYMALLTSQIRLMSRARYFRLPLLRWTLRQHTFYTHQVLCVNREFFREMIFASFLGSLPSSTINLVVSIIKPLPVQEKINLLWWLAFMWMVYAAYLVPMASLSGRIHSPRRYLSRIQYNLGKWDLRCKLQLDSLYHRLTTGPRYGISIGPFTTVTSSVILEFLSSYSQLIMFALMFYFNNK